MNLYSLTLPGLDVRSDWRAVHDRLLDDFRAIDDVLPTTTAATILIAYRGHAEVDEWLGSIDEALLGRRLRGTPAHRGSSDDHRRAPLELRCVGGGVYSPVAVVAIPARHRLRRGCARSAASSSRRLARARCFCSLRELIPHLSRVSSGSAGEDTNPRSPTTGPLNMIASVRATRGTGCRRSHL